MQRRGHAATFQSTGIAKHHLTESDKHAHALSYLHVRRRHTFAHPSTAKGTLFTLARRIGAGKFVCLGALSHRKNGV